MLNNNYQLMKIFLTVSFFIVLIMFNPIQNHLLNGQVDFLVLLFSTLFFYWYERNKLLSNLFLAFAIALKIVPLIFLVFLFTEKKYKDIILTIVFSIICIFILPYLFSGAIIFDYYSYYINNFIFHSFSGYREINSDLMYFTLFGFINHIFNFSTSPALYLQIICAFLIISPIIYSHHRLLKLNVPGRKVIVFSLLSLSILLISPSSQTHHLIFLTPAILLIVINFSAKNEYRVKFILYYISFFILFWLGSVFKYSPLIFLSILTLLFIIVLSKNKFRLDYDKV